MSVYRQKFHRRGRKKLEPVSKWYVSFRDHQAIRRRIPAFTDRRSSVALEANLRCLTSARAAGLGVPPELNIWLESLPATIQQKLATWGLITLQRMAAGKPLREHVSDWVESLRGKGVTPQRAAVAEYRLGRLMAHASFWSELTSEVIRNFLRELRQPKKNSDGDIEPGASASTHNGYVQLIRQFCQWMVREGRATHSPALSLPMLNVKLDRRHVRRPFSVDELRTLLAATNVGPERYGMAGFERAMMYRLAVETGLRSGEIRALTQRHFDLGNKPNICLPGEFTKNGEDADIELRRDTAFLLKEFLAGKLPTASAFNMPPRWNIIDILKADLKAAGIPYADDMGRVLDFHSFRHTCGAWLAVAGSHPKVIQSILRHSDIRLTMDTYGHRLVEQESQALAKLPDLNLPPEIARMKATGTDPKNLGSHLVTPGKLNQFSPDLAGQKKPGMMLTHSPMESTETVEFAGGNKPDAAVAQLVERSFRKA